MPRNFVQLKFLYLHIFFKVAMTLETKLIYYKGSIMPNVLDVHIKWTFIYLTSPSQTCSKFKLFEREIKIRFWFFFYSHLIFNVVIVTFIDYSQYTS